MLCRVGVLVCWFDILVLLVCWRVAWLVREVVHVLVRLVYWCTGVLVCCCISCLYVCMLVGWCVGMLVCCRCVGFLVQWIVCLLACWCVGLLVCWLVGLLVCVCFGVLVCWHDGVRVCWYVVSAC